ncbi:LysR family transcriptional regulator [Nocardioides fonticola]|uniref:LysR family transcriptional regulator n=1 Tax=Nocardioides fonticola TaxID=450363 RepID=A0ABP7XRE3_9ACTN
MGVPLSPHLPPLSALELLVDVARTSSIGAAARLHGISQQAASERLRSIESQVGLALVVRGPRGSSLTPAGRVMVEWAVRLLDVAGEIDAALDTLRAGRDRALHVAASMTVAEHLLPRWLVLLRQRQLTAGQEPTAVSLEATNSRTVLEEVLDGRADIGFVEGSTAPGVRSLEIGTDDLVVVTAPGHPWTRRRRPVTAAELAATALTSREEGSGTRGVLEDALAAAGLEPAAPAVELTTSTAVREAVRAGSPPAVLSRLTVGADVAAGALAVVPVPDLDLRRTLRAVWTGSARPPAGAVRDLLAVATAAE